MLAVLGGIVAWIASGYLRISSSDINHARSVAERNPLPSPPPGYRWREKGRRGEKALAEVWRTGPNFCFVIGSCQMVGTG